MEILRRRSSKSFPKTRKLLGAQKFGAVSFQFWSPFQICEAPAHKGDIRASYAVPQVTLNSRGSLDIGWAMADRRKRGAASGSAFRGWMHCAWINTCSTNWPRCFDLSSSGTSTTQVRRDINTEREGESRSHGEF